MCAHGSSMAGARVQVVASMQQPEILVGAPIALRSLVEGSTGRDSCCALRAAPGGAPADALVALCSANITPERAVAWAAGLFAHVQPQRVVCVSALQVACSSSPKQHWGARVRCPCAPAYSSACQREVPGRCHIDQILGVVTGIYTPKRNTLKKVLLRAPLIG